jgi:hypothetical protein
VLYSLVDDFEIFFARHYRGPEPAEEAAPRREPAEREAVIARERLRPV